MNVEKVGWFDTEEWEKEYLKDKECSFEIEFFEESLNQETAEKIDETFDAVTVLVSSKVNQKVLDKLSVEVIACRSTGFDHVDLKKADEENVKVCNVPKYGATTLAKHTFGLKLTLSRLFH